MSLGIMIEALFSTFDFDICDNDVIEAPIEPNCLSLSYIYIYFPHKKNPCLFEPIWYIVCLATQIA